MQLWLTLAVLYGMSTLHHMGKNGVLGPWFKFLSTFKKPLLFTKELRIVAPAIIIPITVFTKHEDPIDASHGIPHLDRVYICHLCGEDL